MQKYFVPYDIALTLKELRFNEPCYAYYGLGLEKDEFKQLQFHIDYGTSYYHIPIEDNFFAKTKRNSDMGHAPAAPLYDQVTDWFIENHNISIHVHPFVHMKELTVTNKKKYQSFVCFLEKPSVYPFKGGITDEYRKSFETRQEALNIGILKAIELIKQ